LRVNLHDFSFVQLISHLYYIEANIEGLILP